jgi:hypothetical protein
LGGFHGIWKQLGILRRLRMNERYFQALSKVFFLLLAVVVLIKPAAAQQEVQIMVNGPWAYVASPLPSPTPAIFIVAPVAPHHGPVKIFPGEDADQFNTVTSWPMIDTPGQYALDFPHRMDCGPAPTGSPARPYPLPVMDNGIIQMAIKGSTNGFAISIPKPCYYTSAIESRSKISKQDTTGLPEGTYTTWMILHYWVDNVGQATVHIGGSNKFVPFQNNEARDVPAISIVLGSDLPGDTSPRCDSTSVASVKTEGALFQQDLHVHFPRLVAPGNQTHDYVPGCQDQTKLLEGATFATFLRDVAAVESYFKNRTPDKLPTAQKALDDIKETLGVFTPPKEVQQELDRAHEQLHPQKPLSRQIAPRRPGGNDQVLRRTRAFGISRAAGAGDCRGAQMSVDGVIP